MRVAIINHAASPGLVPNDATDTVIAMTDARAATGTVLRRLALPVYLPVIAGTFGLALLIPVLPLYLTRSGVPLGTASFVLAAAGAGAMLGGLPAGALIARFGEYRVLIAALSGIGATTALLGISDAALVLIGLRLGTGASNIGLRLSRQTYITRRVETAARGRSMAMIGGSFRVSLFLGPLVGGLLAETIGFSATFVIAGAFSTIGMIPALIHHAEHGDGLSEATDPVPIEARQRLGLFTTINEHRRLLATAGVVPMLTMAVREGRYVIVPLVGDDLGLSVAAVGALVAVGTLADLVLFPVAGLVMDRFGRLAAMIPSFSLIAVGLLLLGLADSTGGAIVAGIVMGVGNGLSSGTMLTLGSDLAPRADPAPFLAAIAVIQDMGKVIGPLLVGAVGAWLGLGAAAIALAVLMIMVIAWLALVLGETSSYHADMERAHPSGGVVDAGSDTR